MLGPLVITVMFCPLVVFSAVTFKNVQNSDCFKSPTATNSGRNNLNSNAISLKPQERMEQITGEGSTDGSIRKRNTVVDTAIPVGVIELRNYLIKQGQRDRFIEYFEENFIESQAQEKGYVLGQYRVQHADDRFFWIRSFRNMKERSSFLPAFYYGPEWQPHKATANSMLANNDNVYLLRPLVLTNGTLVPGSLASQSRLIPAGGIVVIDFYISNTRLEELLKLFASDYISLLKQNGINRFNLFTSVPEENDFPRLPVFQDKNLLVNITFFESEEQYKEAMNRIDKTMTTDLRDRLLDVVTTRNTLVLYPTKKTTSPKR